ncbi:MAG: T9SS type A sorting domain-containing protein, partial [Ignavibacteria bacterium]|nr:T9SS type A sorting domain-containing protein [Ignavibacteria bacterium]
KDITPPTISSFSMSCTPSITGTITFSEPVYANNNATGNLTSANISVTKSGGSASINTSSITHTAGSNTATVNINWAGTLNGFELVQVSTQSGTSVYDAAGNAMAHPTTATDYANVDITIVSHPSNQSGCVGTNVNFSGSATGGAGLQYKWQLSTDGGNNFSDISDGGVYNGTSTTTLAINGLTSGMNNYQYKLKAYNECDTKYTNAATLTVHPATNITTHPSNTTICQGSTATLTVSAVGVSLSYQWQFWNGSSWANVSNNTPSGASYTGGNSNQLQISGLSAGTYDYRVIVYGGCSPTSVTSNTATVTVNAQPSITGNPSDATVCSGSSTSFSVSSASGTLNWQVSTDGGNSYTDLTNNPPYSGVNSTTLSINNVTTALDGYKYRLKATSGVCNPQFSNAATLTVLTSPSISSHPSNATQCQGNWTQGFSVSASGGSLSYQWQFSSDGVNWSNVTNNTPTGATYSYVGPESLEVNSNVIAPGTYYYRVIVSNTCGSVTSNSAQLIVNPPTSITTHPTSATICQGHTSQQFTVVASYTGTPTYTWQFSSDNSNWSNVTNGTPSGASYSGQNTATLTVTTSSIPPGNNYYYRVIVSGACGTATSNSAQLTINPTTSITTQPPSSVSACAGGSINVNISVSATGTSLTYQWEFSSDHSTWNSVSNGQPTNASYSGATSSTLTITGNVPAGTYYYRVYVSGSCGNVTSNVCTLYVNPPATISSHPSNASQPQGTWSQNFSITASNYSAIQWQYSSDNTNWSNVSNGIPTNAQYSGANTTTLTVQSTGSGIPAGVYYYRAQVTGCQGTINSNSAMLTVTNTPTKLAIITTIGTQVHNQSFNIQVQSQDNSNNPAPVSSNTNVTISVNSGSGTVTGSGTISAGTHTTTISVTYSLSGSDGENNVNLKASASGLSDGVSNTFTVLPTEPTTQASGISLVSRTQSSITVSFTAGNGSGRLVAATKNSSTYNGNTPTDGTSYNIGASFGTNTEIIQKGNVTGATVTGLNNDSWATFRVFEYNGNNVPNYRTTTASNNPRALKSLPKEVQVDAPTANYFLIGGLMPNPVTDEGFTLHLVTDVEGTVVLEVVNELGQIILSNTSYLDAGNHFINLNMPNNGSPNPAGIYFVRVTLNGETLVQKFVYLP